jgi:hypothetical protein
MPGLLTTLACGIGAILLRQPRPTLPDMTPYQTPEPAMTPTQALREIHALVASDAYAMTFQSQAQYRSALLQTINQYQLDIQPHHDSSDCPAAS